jgi:hypothetical protein
MAFDMDHAVSDYAVLLDRLDDALRAAPEPNLSVLSKLIAGACTRIPNLTGAQKNRIVRLAEVGAWTDAVFALIDLELPTWKVRRLAYENGEWFCCMSRQPNLPMTLDDCAEATHETLPLAILCAFLDACRRSRMIQKSASAIPQIQQPMPEHNMMCCDDFA